MVTKTNKEGFVDYDELFDKLLDMNIDLIFRTAYTGWSFREKSGVALMDLRTGELVTKSVEQGKERDSAADHEIVVCYIPADQDIINWDNVLIPSEMLTWGYITPEQYTEIMTGGGKDIIEDVRRRYLQKRNKTLEELAIQEYTRSEELDWVFLHFQLRDRYRE